VFLAAFFYVESHRESPMLPLRFFRIPTFAAANVVAASVFFAMFGTVFFLTLYLQNIQGYSPVQAGIRLLAFSAVILVVAPLSGRLSDRYGSRGFMTVGTLLAATGMALLLRTEPQSAYLTVILPSFIVLASGMAMTMTPMTAAVMGSVETRHAGVASAATNTSRELGGVFGIALLGAVVTSAFKRAFLARLIGLGIPSAKASAIVSQSGSRAAAGALTPEAVLRRSPPGTTLAQAKDIVQGAQASFAHAIHVGLFIAIGFLVLASIVSFVFVRSHVEGGQERFEETPTGERAAVGGH